MTKDRVIYQINNIGLYEKTICQIIEKCYITGLNSLIIVEDEGFQEILNKILWTYSQKTFVPHGSDKDPRPEDQPILISTKPTNLNNPKILVLVGDVKCDIKGFDKVIYILSGSAAHQKLLAALETDEAKIFTMDEKGAWG